MLRYVASGARAYGDRPIPPHVRNVWEFQAVVAGSCSLWLPERRMPGRERTLWLFAPQLRHGWIAERGSGCTICVFHLTSLPEPLRGAIAERGWLELRLAEADAARLRGIAERAAAVAPGDPLAALRAEAASAELCLLVGGLLPAGMLRGPAPASPDRAVAAALAWYREHLAQRPGVAGVARALGISVAQLRRHFQAVQRRAPAAALTEIRLDRADELLRDPGLRLADIAQRAGFANGAMFSRCFRRYRGIPPAAWSRRRRGRPAANLPPALPLAPGR